MTDPVAIGTLTRDEVKDLYERGRNDLYRLAWLIVGDGPLAEDLVQEAFARLWQSPERVREPERVEAYLRSIVLNLARTGWATASRRRSLDDRRAADRSIGDPHTDPSVRRDPTATVDDRELLRAALADLSPNQRTCAVCRYWLDFSDQQIAEATGMAVGTVKTHLRRALANLRVALADDPTATVPSRSQPAPVLDPGAP